MTFYWLTPFADSFVNSDWLELVINFQTNEPTWSTFQTTAIYDEVLSQVCATFGIEAFQEEQQKTIDMFFENNDASVSLSTGYIFYTSSRASDRSPLLSRRNRSLYLLCRPLKLSQKTIEMDLG